MLGCSPCLSLSQIVSTCRSKRLAGESIRAMKFGLLLFISVCQLLLALISFCGQKACEPGDERRVRRFRYCEIWGLLGAVGFALRAALSE